MKEQVKKEPKVVRNLAFIGLIVSIIGVSYVAIRKTNETEQVKNEAQLEREQLRSDYLASFQIIEDNLFEISAHESIIRHNMMKDDQKRLSAEERVQQEIAIIEDLIAQNNKTIAGLEAKLDNQDALLTDYTAKNKRLQRKLSSFKSTIAELEERNIILTQELVGVQQ